MARYSERKSLPSAYLLVPADEEEDEDEANHEGADEDILDAAISVEPSLILHLNDK